MDMASKNAVAPLQLILQLLIKRKIEIETLRPERLCSGSTELHVEQLVQSGQGLANGLLLFG